MKKIHLLIIIALISIFIVSCKKDDEDSTPVDKRGQWVGHYKGNSTGQITLHFGDQSSTQPIDSEMEFDVEKGSNSNEIIMIDETGEKVTGIVNGDKVTFAEMTNNQTVDEVTMNLVNNMTATFSSSSCTLVMTISGTATYSGLTMPVTGSVTTVADKQ